MYQEITVKIEIFSVNERVPESRLLLRLNATCTTPRLLFWMVRNYLTSVRKVCQRWTYLAFPLCSTARPSRLTARACREDKSQSLSSTVQPLRGNGKASLVKPSIGWTLPRGDGSRKVVSDLEDAGLTDYSGTVSVQLLLPFLPLSPRPLHSSGTSLRGGCRHLRRCSSLRTYNNNWNGFRLVMLKRGHFFISELNADQ